MVHGDRDDCAIHVNVNEPDELIYVLMNKTSTFSTPASYHAVSEPRWIRRTME